MPLPETRDAPIREGRSRHVVCSRMRARRSSLARNPRRINAKIADQVRASGLTRGPLSLGKPRAPAMRVSDEKRARAVPRNKWHRQG